MLGPLACAFAGVMLSRVPVQRRRLLIPGGLLAASVVPTLGSWLLLVRGAVSPAVCTEPQGPHTLRQGLLFFPDEVAPHPQPVPPLGGTSVPTGEKGAGATSASSWSHPSLQAELGVGEGLACGLGL